jgi:hypothetical protein
MKILALVAVAVVGRAPAAAGGTEVGPNLSKVRPCEDFSGSRALEATKELKQICDLNEGNITGRIGNDEKKYHAEVEVRYETIYSYARNPAGGERRLRDIYWKGFTMCFQELDEYGCMICKKTVSTEGERYEITQECPESKEVSEVSSTGVRLGVKGLVVAAATALGIIARGHVNRRV